MRQANPSLPGYAVEAIHVRVPGRARFRVYGLKAAPELKTALEDALARDEDIIQASASIHTGKILVRFKDKITHQAIENQIRSLLGFSPSQAPGPKSSSSSQGDPGNPERLDLQAYAAIEDWHRRSVLRTLEIFDVERAAGLTGDAAAEKLREYGKNVLPQRRARSGLAVFADQFKSLPVGLLAAAAGLSLGIGAILDAAVIMGVLGVNSVIGYATERQSDKTIQALQKPAIHYKVLAAGRNDPAKAFAYTASKMRPMDAVCVGVFTKDDPQMLEEDIGLFLDGLRAVGQYSG